MSVSFNRGQQIVYIPHHVLRQYKPSGEWKLDDLLEHPKVEFGFIMGNNGNMAFCRFWSRTNNFAELRTKANSELVPQSNLFEYKLKPQNVVDRILESL